MSTATKKQIIIINTILSRLGEAESKPALAMSYSAQRTSHISQLTTAEAAELVKDLQKYSTSPADRMRKKIISLAHQMGWRSPEGKINMAQLDGWCTKYGQYHKPLNSHSVKELGRLVTQFEAVFKSFIKSI